MHNGKYPRHLFTYDTRNERTSFVVTKTGLKKKSDTRRLEALAVDDRGAGLVVLLLGDPHRLEGGERGQDGATDPDGVLALRGSDDLDLHGGRSQGGDLLLHTLSDTLEHGGTTGQDGVAVEVLADIDVALHDGVVGGLVDTRLFHADQRGLEQDLGATETLVTDGDDLTIRQLVGLLELGRGGSLLHLGIEVEGNVTELLFDVTNDFTLGGGGEGITTLGQDLHHVVGQVTAGQVQTQDSVGKGITFVDGDGVGDTITGVQDDTGGTAGSVQGQDGLNGDVHGGGVEGLEHDLSHLLTVGLGVQGGLGEEDGVLLGGDTELVVEGVVPDLLHIVPVGDDTVLNGVLEGQDTTLGLSLIADVGILLAHADHDTLVTGATNDGGENGAGCVITGETSLAHTGTVVHDQSLSCLFACFCHCYWREKRWVRHMSNRTERALE
jgi:hypothetical protein